MATLAVARDAFLVHFGRRAFRRPLEPDELTRYGALFNQGPEVLDNTDLFSAGVEVVLSAMLQSPYFLYRVERSREVGADGLIALDGWELVTRLSYTLWNTTPTDTLLDAVLAGDLSTDVGIHALVDDMLDDVRMREAVGDFHHQYMHTSPYDDIQKDPGLFPDFGDQTGTHMRTEMELFVQGVILDDEGGVSELLLSPHTFVNDELAALYGLKGDGFGDDFERVELDPAERSGVLTRLGFLAERASLAHPSPITRGLLLVERFLCVDLPPPPPNVPGVPPESAPTNRERVELHTGDNTCGQGCHSTILNPPGFAFEHYDAVGRFRREDNGFPVDATGTYVLDGDTVAFEDAISWSERLAASEQVHRCYTRHWLEYLYGRPVGVGDVPLLDEISAASRAGDVSIKGIIRALLTTDAFLKRSPDVGDEEGGP